MNRLESRFFMKTTNYILALAMPLLAAFLSACTRDGDTFYLPYPASPTPTTPLVTVIYNANSLGDRSYNDLIYQGVEQAARKHSLRTLQLSPQDYDEGKVYLQNMFQNVAATKSDTVRRLYLVCAAGYDDYIRQNCHIFAENPYADLLYFETPDPLPEECGSTLFLPYYGAMYETGAITPMYNAQVLIICANPVDQPVVGAMQGFSDGFSTDYFDPPLLEWYQEKHIHTCYISQESGQGYSTTESAAFKLIEDNMVSEYYDDSPILVPICGGAGNKFQYMIDIIGSFNIVGVDVDPIKTSCPIATVKHIDRAVERCIAQWLTPEGMPHHQVLGLQSGYTETICHYYHPMSQDYFESYIDKDLRQQIHDDAIRKEEEYEK